MILGLTGYAGSGKDALAKSLKLRGDFYRIAFADKVREMALTLNPDIFSEEYDSYFELRRFVDRVGWDAAKKEDEVREYLQRLGHGSREVLGDDVWVRASRATLIGHLEQNHNVVFTDVRYHNELSFIKANGGKVFRIEREGVVAVNGHITETNVDDLPVDGVIFNNGSIQDLSQEATDLLRKL